jgi:hypothetical protein
VNQNYGGRYASVSMDRKPSAKRNMEDYGKMRERELSVQKENMNLESQMKKYNNMMNANKKLRAPDGVIKKKLDVILGRSPYNPGKNPHGGAGDSNDYMKIRGVGYNGGGREGSINNSHEGKSNIQKTPVNYKLEMLKKPKSRNGLALPKLSVGNGSKDKENRHQERLPKL